MNNKDFIKKLVLGAMFLAIGIILPFFTGQIPQIGRMLLPMHIPVFLCGLICGWQYGLAVGFILPLMRSMLFFMPLSRTGCLIWPKERLRTSSTRTRRV
jgi:thiamine transporter ThiT